MQKIIRHESTADRGLPARVSADEVFQIVKEMEISFTTCDIADIIVANGKHRGVSYERIERSVRAAVFWLVERDIAYVSGESVKVTCSGCVSRPNKYSVYPGRTWNKQKHETERSSASVDFNLLNRAFVFR